ncbi:MAG: hypothetical protein GWP42_09960 [Verrucomicrobiales bacterium]|nr:hypothetical protein [Verrucomicrobiales bacterium]NCG27850.1 hypothetical protein [Verrucomicrobiales bacterium]
MYSGKVLGYKDGTRQLYYRACFIKGRLDGPGIRWYRNGNKWGEREFDNVEVIEGSYELWKKTVKLFLIG